MTYKTRGSSIWSFVLVAILYAVVASPNIFLLSVEYSPLDLHGRFVALVGCAAILITLAVIQRHYSRPIAAVLAGLAILASLELTFAMKFGTLIDENTLSLVAETNTAELGDLISALPPIAFLPFGLVVVVCYCAILYPYRSPHRDFGWLVFVGPVVMLVLAAATFNGWKTDAEKESDSEFPAPATDQQMALRSSFPGGLPFLFHEFYLQREALAQAFERNRKYRFGTTRIEASPQSHRKIFVLVIGETARADHWSINGYKRQTNPLLEKQAGVTSFAHMYSFSTFSRRAVPILISRKPEASGSAIFDEASIVTAFKEVGFATTWISMQAPVGFHESPISVHAYEAGSTMFLNPVDYRSHGKTDTAALKSIKKLIDADTGDQFIVLHTLGSHYRYVDRYPKELGEFLPDRYDNKVESLFEIADKNVLINAYDNSILETDRLLDGLIKALSQSSSESWLFYSSDHGEALFDDCKNESGHGTSSAWTHSVAAMFWASDSYIKKNGSLVANLKANSTKQLSTSMVFATLSSLGGIVVPGNRPSLDVTSVQVKTPPEIAGLDLSPRECRN